MTYNETTRRHFETAANAGVLPDVERRPSAKVSAAEEIVSGAAAMRGAARPAEITRRGAAGGFAQGTWVQFDVRLDLRPEIPVVAAVRFLAYGCPHVIAAADWVAGAAIGMRASPRLPEDVHSLRARFEAPIEKLGRFLVIEDAWIAALQSPYYP